MRFPSPVLSNDSHGHGHGDHGHDKHDGHAHGDAHGHGHDDHGHGAHAAHGRDAHGHDAHGHDAGHGHDAHAATAHGHADHGRAPAAYAAADTGHGHASGHDSHVAAVAPVWASGGGRRRRGNPLVGLLVTLLALFGAVTAVLGVKEGSVEEGGAVVDSWIAAGMAYARGLMDGDDTTEAPAADATPAPSTTAPAAATAPAPVTPAAAPSAPTA